MAQELATHVCVTLYKFSVVGVSSNLDLNFIFYRLFNIFS